MSQNALLAMMLGLLSSFGQQDDGETSISSHPVKMPKQHTEPSKRKLKKMKGKKARRNRGKNR